MSAGALSRRALLTSVGLLRAAPRLKILRLKTRKYTIGRRDYLFVEMETDGGITGLGEASISGRVDIVEQAVLFFVPYLTGMDAAGVEEHWNRNYYRLSRYRSGPVLMTALSAIDLALWDIAGKALGLPLWRLLGGSQAPRFRAYYSHWSQELNSRTPEKLAELAAKTAQEGWTCVKWVVGRGGSEPQRLRTLVGEVEAVRRGGGPDLDIALELWETFTVRTAIEFARAAAPHRVLFIEEPVWREMPDALGEVAAASPVAVAGGEGLVSRYEFKQLLDRRGARIIQPDVIHCGGITEMRKIASLAEVYGVEIAPHMFYGPVAHVASLHAMTAVPNFLMQEWDAALEPLFREITSGSFPAVTKGHVTLGEKAGLGVEMDWAECDRRFPYKGPSQRPPGGGK
jgi:galactonate dehydratase